MIDGRGMRGLTRPASGPAKRNCLPEETALLFLFRHGWFGFGCDLLLLLLVSAGGLGGLL